MDGLKSPGGLFNPLQSLDWAADVARSDSEYDQAEVERNFTLRFQYILKLQVIRSCLQTEITDI